MSKPIKYCPYCGEELKFRFNRKYDHLGPLEDGTWEQLDHKCTEPLKKMCLNCQYFEGKRCINDKALQDIMSKIKKSVEPFALGYVQFSLINTRECCDHWKLDEKLASSLFK